MLPGAESHAGQSISHSFGILTLSDVVNSFYMCRNIGNRKEVGLD